MPALLQDPIKVSTDHYMLRIDASSVGTPAPGQFINIKINANTDPLIRRPFSIFNFDNSGLEIIFRVVGKGTAIMTRYAGGQSIDFLGPFGNGFTPVTDKKVLVLGGGVGNAPLYYLMRSLRERNNRIFYIYGARSNEYVYLSDNYRAMAHNFILSTDDGSAGVKGYVTEVAGKILCKENFDFVYTCGPLPMMTGISEILKSMDVPFEASLENYFGCGIGLCSGCTVRTANGLKRACVDGPVMDGRIIDWASLKSDL